MKTYRSPRLGLIINGEPHGPRVEFSEGTYSTGDKSEQDMIESSPGFGVYIFSDEVRPASRVAPKKTRPKKQKKETDPVDSLPDDLGELLGD